MPLLKIAGGQIATVATFYKASELLGSGRFSEVYKAFDSHSQTDVALKLYLGADEIALGLARNEQDLLTKLGELNSQYFPRLRRAAKHRVRNRNHPLLVLELGRYVGPDGRQSVVSLADALKSVEVPERTAPLPDADFWLSERLCQWIVDCVQAVRQLHAAGIVHRDIKPSNILLKRSAGQAATVPFFLDFNSATDAGEREVRSGTPRYLPPEVTSGHRREPEPTDDLWAIALVGWEILYGAGSSPHAASQPHRRLRGEVPESFVDSLRRALSLKPEDRFESALSLLKALDELPALVDSGQQLSDVRVSSDEYSSARSAMEGIRWSMEEAFASQDTIAIPKEIEDTVATLFSWLSEEQTQSLDLVSELHHLGPKAIPCSLEQSYKLRPGSPSFKEVLHSLQKLASDDPVTTERAVQMYSLSSNTNARSMCRGLCDASGLFPDVLLESLMTDEGILLPSERLELAELCIRHSSNDTAILALSKYMCREYILNLDNYGPLRARIAQKMGEMRFEDKALLIVQDTAQKIWEELPEYEKLSQPKRREMDKGLLELTADAFASMGDDALSVLRDGRVPRQIEGDPPLRVFRRFAHKLATKHPATRQWLTDQRRRHPEDQDLDAAMPTAEQMPQKDLDTAFDSYLANGNQRDYNALRFSKGRAVFEMIHKLLRQRVDCGQVDRLITLLNGFQNRQRLSVCLCLLENWNLFTSRNYAAVVEILTQYYVPRQIRTSVIERLSAALKTQNEPHARRGLEKMLD